MQETECRSENGNCTAATDADGLRVQCIGRWSLEKHKVLRQYIDATQHVRKKFIGPGKGGAAFVDLFAGPGRARVKGTGEFVDGSPLIAASHDGAPFSKIILCEADQENHAALKERTAGHGSRVKVLSGDCNDLIDEVLKQLPKAGLNLALIDPYNVGPLSFETLAKLGRSGRMDLLLHFPTSDIRRKFGRKLFGYLDRFLGSPEWRSVVTKAEQVPQLIPFLRGRLSTLGYSDEEVQSHPVRADAQVLYHIVYITKHDTGSKIWKAITRIGPGGQRGLQFE